MKHFEYSRRVGFCDTDAMAVVHHANYLRFYEEARVAWMRARELQETHFPIADAALAVIESKVLHLRPAGFDDKLIIRLQVRREGLKIVFRYDMHIEGKPELISTCETSHVMVNKSMKAVRIAKKFLTALEREPWTETWPLSL
jgi:acyl-CoA thioester hydrolase